MILDWSENHFNGIGDEMQHYQEMLAIGLGRDAAYRQTQPPCGHGLGGSPAPPSVAHVVGVPLRPRGLLHRHTRRDWRWMGRRSGVADELAPINETRADELVVTWSPKGMYYRTGRDGSSGAEGGESPDGTYVAPPTPTPSR